MSRPTLDELTSAALGNGGGGSMSAAPTPTSSSSSTSSLSQVQSQPQASHPGAIPPDGNALSTQYSEPLRDLVRFLETVTRMRPGPYPPGTDLTPVFHDAWAETMSPSTVPEMTVAIRRLHDLRLEHFAGVLAAVDDKTRQYFHATSMALANAVAKDMPELAQASSMLRWVLGQALPAVKNLPEDIAFGTTQEVRKKYAMLDAAAQTVRPDESIPEVHNLRQKVGELTEVATNLKTEAAGVAAKHAALETASAAATQSAASFRTATIILAVIAVLALIALGVLVWLYVTAKSNKGKSSASASGAAPAAALSFGGVTHSHSHHPIVTDDALDGGFNWGFPRLSSVAEE